MQWNMQLNTLVDTLQHVLSPYLRRCRSIAQVDVIAVAAAAMGAAMRSAQRLTQRRLPLVTERKNPVQKARLSTLGGGMLQLFRP